MKQPAIDKGQSYTAGISSWYDGFIYRVLINPFSNVLAKTVAECIEQNSSVLDVGCGTGQLAFQLSQKCRRVVGIDFSRKMVEYASRRKARRRMENVAFVHGNAADVSKIFSERFDYVTAVMCLHEMDPLSRHRVIAGCLELTDRVILTDYASQFQGNFLSPVRTLIEFCAGKSHFAGYRDWQERGGLEGFIGQKNLDVRRRIPGRNKFVETVIVSGRRPPGAGE